MSGHDGDQPASVADPFSPRWSEIRSAEVRHRPAGVPQLGIDSLPARCAFALMGHENVSGWP